MGSTYRVEFNAPVYNAGDTVRGQVKMLVPFPNGNKSFKTSLIFVEVKGKARWSIDRTQGRKGKDKEQDWVFFRHRWNIFGDGETDSILAPGLHTYPMEVKLPENLPSTLTSHHGQIYYSVVISCHRAYGFFSTNKFRFQVRGILNLAKLDLKPIALDVTKPARYLFALEAGHVALQFGMDRATILCGNEVPFHLNVCNMCFGSVYQLRVELLQTLRFKNIQGKEFYVRTKPVATVINCVNILPLTRFKWSGDTFKISESVPPTNKKSKIISISYSILVEARIKGMTWKNVSEVIPVIVGSAWLSTDPPTYEDVMKGQMAGHVSSVVSSPGETGDQIQITSPDSICQEV